MSTETNISPPTAAGQISRLPHRNGNPFAVVHSSLAATSRVAVRAARAMIPITRFRHHAPRPLRLSPVNLSAGPPQSPPSISIVTPSFNQAKFLQRTINSVVRQRYPRLEFVVQDGGSTDGSVEILKRCSHALHHWESAPDNGQADAINKGFRHTSGEIMGWLNSDDLLLDGALNLAARFFSDHPEVDLVYGHRILIDEEDQEIGRWVLPPHDARTLRWFDYVPQETMLWRRRLWDKVGGAVDNSLQFAMDWDLLLRFHEAGAQCARLPYFLGAFRVHSAQKTMAQAAAVGKPEVRRLRERSFGYVPSFAQVAMRSSPYLARHVAQHVLHRLHILRY